MSFVLSAVLLWSMIAGIFVLPVILRIWVGDEPRNQDPGDTGEPDEDLADLDVRDDEPEPAPDERPGPMMLKAA